MYTGQLIANSGTSTINTLSVTNTLTVEAANNAGSRFKDDLTVDGDIYVGGNVIGGAVPDIIIPLTLGDLTETIDDYTVHPTLNTVTTQSVFSTPSINATQQLTSPFINVMGLATVDKLYSLSVANATSSTDSAAAVKVDGGAAVAKSIYVGQDLNVTGTTTLGTTNLGAVTTAGKLRVNNNTDILGTATSIYTAGGLQVAKRLKVEDTETSTSSSTGAVQVDGGVGIAGTIYAGGAVTVANSTASTSTSTGALKVTGGVGVGGAMNVGGAVSVESATASTSTSTGAVKVTGGIGCGGRVHAANLHAGTITYGSAYKLTTTPTAVIASTHGYSNSDHSGQLLLLDTTATPPGGDSLQKGGAICFAGGAADAGTDYYIVSGRIRGVPATNVYGGSLDFEVSNSAGNMLRGMRLNGESLNVTFDSTTDATSSTAASVTMAGGLGVAKSCYVGGNLNVSGTFAPTGPLTINNTTESSSTGSGALICAGGIGITKKLNVGGLVTANDGMVINGGPLDVNDEFFATCDVYRDISNSTSTGITYSFAGQTGRKIRIIRTGLSGPVTDTLPAATDLYTDFGNRVNVSFELLIMNESAETITIAIGSGGVDYFPTPPTALSGRARLLIFYITSSSTYDCFFHL